MRELKNGGKEKNQGKTGLDIVSQKNIIYT